MNTITGLLLLISLLVQLSFQNKFQGQLIQIQTLSRDGQRIPNTEYPFKSDSDWVHGLGNLSEDGKYQMKELGSFLRSTYRVLLSEAFSEEEFSMTSSFTNSTIMSAQTLLSTLFKEQSVPIHTIPPDEDFILGMTGSCPIYQISIDTKINSFGSEERSSEYLSFFKKLEDLTGIPNVNFDAAWSICKTALNWDSALIKLRKDKSYEGCGKFFNTALSLIYETSYLSNLGGGPLAVTMTDNMLQRANSFLDKKPGLKMIGYFAHDTTIAALLTHLGNYNNIQPPFASSLIFELSFLSNASVINSDFLSQFYVRMLYRNDTNALPRVLKIDLCENLGTPYTDYCPLTGLHKSVEYKRMQSFSLKCNENSGKRSLKMKNVKTRNAASVLSEF